MLGPLGRVNDRGDQELTLAFEVVGCPRDVTDIDGVQCAAFDRALGQPMDELALPAAFRHRTRGVCHRAQHALGNLRRHQQLSRRPESVIREHDHTRTLDNASDTHVTSWRRDVVTT